MGVYFWNLVSKIVFFSFGAPHSYPGTDGVKFGVEESTLISPPIGTGLSTLRFEKPQNRPVSIFIYRTASNTVCTKLRFLLTSCLRQSLIHDEYFIAF